MDEKEDNSWLETYADAITLLLAFFVMLVSFSDINLSVFEEVQAGIKEQLSGEVENDRPIFALHSNLLEMQDEITEIDPEQIDVAFDEDGVVLDFASGSFFKSGTAELTDVAMLVLGKVKRELEEPPYDLFLVDVEGHTDDVEISTAAFPSNWELSASRAARVVRFFIAQGMPPTSLKAAGYADTKPKVPNYDIMGEAIDENRAQNRRITIKLHR
jgi:chemotaxis protein MotB